MKVVIAPDSFKGSLDAAQVCAALERGVQAAVPDVETVCVPLADGGEGTVSALVAATGGRLVTRDVSGPLGEPTSAAFGMLGDGKTAVLEMAAASGLTLIAPAARNPLLTTTFGTGELMRAALDLGAEKLIIGIGGSATTDGGAGMAQALGARMLDRAGVAIPRATGGRLCEIARIDGSGLDARLASTEVVVACDVDNPLYGERGAAAVYGPQKGATPQMVAALDAGLQHFAGRLREDLGADVAAVAGAGAAGGLGAGLMAFCGARLQRGIDIVIEAVGLRRQLAGANLVLTGEGRIDAQTAHGKTPHGVARVAADAGVPVVAIGGSVDIGAGGLDCFTAVLPMLPEPMTLAEAMAADRAEAMLEFVAGQVVRMWVRGTGRNRLPDGETGHRA